MPKIFSITKDIIYAFSTAWASYTAASFLTKNELAKPLIASVGMAVSWFIKQKAEKIESHPKEENIENYKSNLPDYQTNHVERIKQKSKQESSLNL